MTRTEAASADAAEEIDAFAARLLGIYTGALMNYMIDIGHRTGLLTAAASGPGTCAQLAERAGCSPRYVQEWLGAMVTGGVMNYEPDRDTFWLPPERAACLTDGTTNLAPMALLHTHLAKHVHQVARAFREGGGVPYAEFRPEITDLMDSVSRNIYDAFLLDAYLPLVPGLRAQLETGARAADIACGTGHALVLLAGTFPRSTFVGIDLDEGAIARARAEARGAGCANVRFEVRDAARFETETPFDVVFVFDAVHDQVDPTAVLDRIHAALAPGGWFLMKEPHAADRLADNLGDPMAPILYAVSTLHCMTVSLAHGGAGIGAMFGEGLAHQMLNDAAFTDIHQHVAPGDPADAVYVSRKAQS